MRLIFTIPKQQLFANVRIKKQMKLFISFQQMIIIALTICGTMHLKTIVTQDVISYYYIEIFHTNTMSLLKTLSK